MLKMFAEARDITRLLKFMSKGEGMTSNIVDIHWVLLPVDHVVRAMLSDITGL